jgi:acetylornithine deacetylase/succinyl-diaminopimelate desuccinylase-like protein
MIDWNSVGEEAAQLLSGYLKIKSLNPPGDERETAAYMGKLLKERGMESKQFASGETRRNLLARLPGDGSKKAILLYNHMDVVEVERERWTCDPFGGEIRDGYVYGRGALDMKGMGIMQLLALDLLKRHQPNRTRDIIFFSAADEEKGGDFGAQWMIRNHWPEVEAEFNWDEGGFGLRDLFGPQPVFTVAVAEKKALWVKLIAHGQPGHGGMPHDNNAAVILMKALQRVLKLNSQYELNPVVKTMFRKVSALMPFPKSFLLKHLDNPLIFKLALPALSGNGTIGAMLRDTVSVTVLKAGAKENVIPETAEATLDIRLLPDHTTAAFLESLKQLIGDERVEIEIIQAPVEGKTTDTNSEFFRTMSEVIGELVPGSVTTPMLTPGGTDSCHFRGKGVNCYGLVPAIIDPEEMKGFHGNDERISIENLALGTRIIYEVLCRMCG